MSPLMALLACATLHSQFLDEQDSHTFGRAASEYWLALRWNDADGAARWLTDPADRLRLGRMLSEPRFKLTDADVVQVVLGDALPKERRPETREGVVLVRLEAMDLVRNRVEVVTFEQHWIKGDTGWRVDPDRSPISADRPW